jgi:flagellar hook-basal body complex protein FliE
MTIEAIGASGGMAITPPVTAPAAPSRAESVDFSRWMTQEVHALNDKIASAEQSLSQLATGQSANLHSTMIELENARVAFQLALQVRNKLLEGYQDIMRMQI